jgi:SMI1 / KNR4 family (SUKH-1)
MNTWSPREEREGQVDRTGWKAFLERWNEELLITGAEPHSELGKPLTDGWFGYPPASEEQVAATEARLGCALPPSLREFLLTSDGWQALGYFGGELRGTGELGWLRDLDPMWAEVYEDIDDFDLHDEAAILRRGLMLSEGADAGVIFLDPEDVDETGEWAAYEVYSWTAEGLEGRRSFHDLVRHLYAGYHALTRPECRTQRDWDAEGRAGPGGEPGGRGGRPDGRAGGGGELRT